MNAANIKEGEEDLKIASKILEWEIGDIWGHVGVRLPENQGIAVKLFRPPDDDDEEDLPAAGGLHRDAGGGQWRLLGAFHRVNYSSLAPLALQAARHPALNCGCASTG